MLANAELKREREREREREEGREREREEGRERERGRGRERETFSNKCVIRITYSVLTKRGVEYNGKRNRNKNVSRGNTQFWIHHAKPLRIKHVIY
jgi:hypothetical protein